ncbi:TniQ family protein [Antarcticirhabdus aurantiaca]|uniref:TniQ family protein n=1 Tax=Antarcticirhabdus aurantiaca TaxID=2606717 RepID=A0ACD4NRU5_9HYPH|nr:TniQ family protein [Jeongeuplla avenae]
MGRDGARRLCKDFGISWHALLRGDAQAVRDVARLGSADPEALLPLAFRRIEGERLVHRGMVLQKGMVAGRRLRFCPACLESDVSSGRGRPEARAWRRSEWLLADVASCSEHGVELNELGSLPVKVAEDFSRAVAAALPLLSEAVRSAIPCPASGFERHVLRRLSGIDPTDPGEAWLHGVPLFAAIRFCEVVGAVALEGIGAPERKLRDKGTRRRQAAGYEIAAGGPQAFRDFLSRLQRAQGRGTAKPGPQAVFGRLYLWLNHAPRDPAYDAFREVLREHCMDTMALGPGDRIAPFGSPVPTRRLHSIRSAAMEYGINQVTLRRILFTTGVASPAQSDLTDDQVTFDADANKDFLRDLTSSLTLEEAAARVDASPGQLLALVDAGLVPTWIGSHVEGSNRHRFRPSDLDGFLGALRVRIDASSPADRPLAGIETAARRACRPPACVAALVLSGGLTRLGNSGQRVGYRSVLVDPGEVRTALVPEEEGDLSLAAVRNATGIARHVLAALVRSGILVGRSARHPVNGTTRFLVPPADLERFRATYVPLASLAAGCEVTPQLLKRRLDASGVEPALDPAVAKAVIYRRVDIPDLASLDLRPWPSGKRRSAPRRV